MVVICLNQRLLLCSFFFFLNDPAPPEIYPLPLHAPLPTPRHDRFPGGGRLQEHDAESFHLHATPPGPAWHGEDVARRVVGRELLIGHGTGEDDGRSEEHTSELQSRLHLVCRLLLEKKKTTK